MKSGSQRKGRGRPRSAELDNITAAGGYSRRQANRILKEAKEGGEEITDLASARLRKTKLEGDKLEYSLQVLKGLHIPKAKVEEDGIALGMAVKAQLLSWVGALPGRLEGLTAAAMVPIFEAEIAKILQTLSTDVD